METIWQTAMNTPWWVYFLFAYLLKVGFKASQTSIVSLKKLFIMPIIFSYLSIQTLISSVELNTINVITWSAAIIVGILLGYWQIACKNIDIDKTHKLVRTPGTWSTLIIILLIFFSKYYFDFELAVHPSLAKQTSFEFALLTVSGICTGLFIGRLICYIKRMRTNQHVNLKTN